MPLGTIANIITVIIGSLIGTAVGKAFPPKMKNIIFQGMGLFTIGLGVYMFLKVKDPVVLVFCMIIGGLTGEGLKLEQGIERFGNWLKTRVNSKDPRFTEGMITAFLIFCVGSMTVVGAIDEGLRGDHSLLYTKALMDGFVSISLAATLGIGVMFSIIPLFIFQYGITLAAMLLRDFFTDMMIDQITAVGGLLILGIGINLLEIRKIKLISFLPAILIIVGVSAVTEYLL